jgi:hypothetical protein
MTTTEQTPSNTRSQTTIARPLTTLAPARYRGAGRPPKLVMPDLPELQMTDVERPLFDYFIDSYNQEYPDLTATDHLTLFLAAIEFIKYLRVAARELETGEVITMSRQHPGVNFRALLDQLSVTRRARTARSRPDDDADSKELKDFFLGMSKGRS